MNWKYIIVTLVMLAIQAGMILAARDSGIEKGRALGRAETQSLANNFTVSVAWKELNAMLIRQAKTGWQIRLEGENGKPVILNVIRMTDDSGRYPKR